MHFNALSRKGRLASRSPLLVHNVGRHMTPGYMPRKWMSLFRSSFYVMGTYRAGRHMYRQVNPWLERFLIGIATLCVLTNGQPLAILLR